MKFQEAILNKKLIKYHQAIIDLVSIYLIKNKKCKDIDIEMIDIDYMGFVLQNTQNDKFLSFLIDGNINIIVYYNISKPLLELNKLNLNSLTKALNEFFTI